jgi:zinc protease
MYARALLALTLLLPPLAGASPKIEHWSLANGTRVYFVPARVLPMVQLRVVFDAAAARDPQDKAGLARLTSDMLSEGADGLTADQIADRFEGLGAEFGSGAERDMATVDLRSLTDPKLLEPALDLFARVLTAPTFPAASLERERQRAVTELARDAQSPGKVAQKAFMRTLYGGHPYAHDPAGTAESIARIARDDLIAHHARYYVAQNARLVIVGDLSASEARRVAEKVMGRLPPGVPAPALPSVEPLVYARVDHVRFPSSQSHLLIGQPALARGDPDYYALYVGNHVFGGGGLVSRLSSEVRERRGLAYSVYSFFTPMRLAGPFAMGLQTANANRDEAVMLLRNMLDEYIKKGPTEQELAAAKQHITGGFPLQLDSNRKIADHVAVIAYYDLPLNYLEEFPARAAAVTAEQIREAFARHVQPDQMVTVTVGGDS